MTNSQVPANRCELHHDLVYEILTRLPVKTLSRFRCVCKPWNSLISRPVFQADHHRRQSPVTLVAPNEYDGSGFYVCTVHFSTYSADHGVLLNSFSKTVPKSLAPYRMSQSCLGLVCLWTNAGQILLCNPSTEELIELPRPSSGEYDFGRQVGLGLAATSGDFKVVCFFRRDYPVKNCCEIFTVGSSQWWREARSPPFYPDCVVLLHGALHLLPERFSEVQYIAVFDIDTEEYRGEILLPDVYFAERARGPCGHTNYSDFSEVSGSLCLTYNKLRTQQVAEVWMLKDYNSGNWVKQYSIYLASDHVYAFPIAIMGDGILLNCHDYEHLKSRPSQSLQLYDAKEICFAWRIETTTQKEKGCGSVVQYVEGFFALPKL